MSGSMTERAPIHLGSGEPMVLLHPFMMSQNVWKEVAPLIAGIDVADPAAPATGRYEVFAPTMPGHNGGTRGPFFLDSGSLADDVERRMDGLGWDTAHIVGNSLGGWVAFELERRGRARSVTGVAPAGGWTRWSLVKFEVIAKFISGMPILGLSRWLGPRVLFLPFSRRLATLPISGSSDGVSERQLSGIIDDAAHCPAYFQLLLKALMMPGLLELAETAVPAHLVVCSKDRVVPPSRFSTHFTDFLPANTEVTKLDGVGHVPMFEAPGRVSEVLIDFLDKYSAPSQAENPGATG
jgi:pimeloyl-ACP methyl ester carboxylesterase